MNKINTQMTEFLLWSNCSNNCSFCWQKKINNKQCFLSEEEKIKCIDKVFEKINSIEKETDVLLVGGEAFEFTTIEVANKLVSLFIFILDKIKQSKIRYLYINTNLIYDDLFIIHKLCTIFSSYEEKLKFTTSYDLKGRFSSDERRQLFLKNLKSITNTYPKINIVVNTILTKEVCNSDFNVKKFSNDYGVRTVCLIPYIPIYYGDKLTPSYGEIFNKLLQTNKEIPNYLQWYCNNFNINQDRVLYEYHKDINDFINCTSQYSECGHNINFKKVLKNNNCFICELNKFMETI